MPESPAVSPAGLVGNAAARAIHGHSAGADCFLLTDSQAASDPGDLATILAQVCAPTTVRTAVELAELAAAAVTGSGPMVLADADLRLELPAVLDLLDGPADVTATLLADPRNVEAPTQPEHGLELATLARVDADGRVSSSGSARHVVTDPNRLLIGLLRIRGADRARAAELWRGAADQVAARPEAYAGCRLLDLALLALVRGGLPVAGRTLGYYTWSRGRSGQTGLGSSAWRQRLRTVSRLGDGAWSAAVIRPLSRIGTRLGLRIGLTPNLVTAISLAVGILAGLLIITGSPIGWIAAALLLQLALVIDCMDGEIARFTRRFSAFGGWLDGIGDRIKEYLVFAAVAVVAEREGHPSGWLLAMIAMVIVTGRHLEDYAYTDRTTTVRRAAAAGSNDSAYLPFDQPLDQPLDQPGDRSETVAGRRTQLPPPITARQRISFWAKKIAHVPIAERYLVLSLFLLTLRPVWVLVAAIAVSAFALTWTVGGRLLRALRGGPVPATGTLDQQLDLGLLARAVGRVRLGFLPGVLIMIIGWLALITGICTGWWPLTLVAGVLTVVIMGCTFRAPVAHRFGWLALPLVWAAESAVLGALLSRQVAGWLIFVALAAIAYRRYELIYSTRLRGTGGPQPLLGCDGRLLLTAVLTVIAALTPDGSAVLAAGLVLLTVETLAEAVFGTVRRWRRTPS